MASTQQQIDKYRVVLRMRGMFPNDLAGYEAHRLRKGGDISHVDKDRSHLNQTFIGKETWAAEALEKTQQIRLGNFLDEVTALRKRKRKKDAERRLVEGPKDPWRATRHGPLRKIILTANHAYFEDEMAKFLGEDPMSKKTDRLIEALKASARQDGEKDAETRERSAPPW